MGKKRRGMAAAVLVLAALFFTWSLFRVKINPVIEAVARAKVDDIASNIINQAVSDQIAADDIQYTDLISLVSTESGAVTALTTNMKELNRFKTDLLNRLNGDSYHIDDMEIGIPLGNISGIEILSGYGPRIPVRILAVSSSDAEYQSEFTSAGINQTVHRVNMLVSMELMIMLPSGTITETVSSSVYVAETVLLGEVPEGYVYLNQRMEE